MPLITTTAVAPIGNVPERTGVLSLVTLSSDTPTELSLKASSEPPGGIGASLRLGLSSFEIGCESVFPSEV